ncbi:hypothetical protein HMPREF9073_01200 [Capnocytophaga sp. oral taxon 326 str. F0382]|nr:hypothetical protein HMPREF9073_01200 [Capnocytophaga sp. oral taxon 326 str. F0382]
MIVQVFYNSINGMPKASNSIVIIRIGFRGFIKVKKGFIMD